MEGGPCELSLARAGCQADLKFIFVTPSLSVNQELFTFNFGNEGRKVKNILGVWGQVLQEKTGAVS